MWIGGTANISFKVTRANGDQPLPFPLDRNCHLLFSARYALFHALAALGLGNGDRLLVPAYCCGTEIDPILARKINIQWYELDESHRINIRQLKEQWREDIKGLLVTHYFGFNQLMSEIIDFCREKKILLIEDCAHAFLSSAENGEPLGVIGDASIFSIRKSLPIPDGGAFCIKNMVSSTQNLKLRRPNIYPVIFRVAELLEWNSTRSDSFKDQARSYSLKYVGKAIRRAKLVFNVLYKLTGAFDTCLYHINAYDFLEEAVDWKVSHFSKKRLSNQDWEGIIKQRRNNFLFLLEKLNNLKILKPLFNTLPMGTCPLFFPVLTKNREALQSTLAAHGVDSHPWWGYFHPAIPWDSFPLAVRLKKNVLGFPIHQDLNETHMERIAWVLNSITNNH